MDPRVFPEELGEMEVEVDNAYRANPLLSLPRSEAMWYLLAECEEQYLRLYHQGKQPTGGFVDAVLNLARWPLRWLWKDCEAQGKLRRHSMPDKYSTSAQGLAELGRKYEWFEAAVHYAIEGRLRLERKGRSIHPTWEDCLHVRYDAYDRLRDGAEKSMEGGADSLSSSIWEDVARTVQVRGSSFEYAFNPKIFNRTYALVDPLLSTRFRMPQSGNCQQRSFVSTQLS